MFLTHALRAIYRAAVTTGDSLWKFVTLLISGTPPAVTFISDASTNGNVLTLNGDTRPSNFNPYTPGYYSNFFDGTGDYLTFPSNAAFVFGTGDFTIELWVNQQNWNPSGGAYYSHWISINSYLSGIMVRPNTTGTGIQVYVGGTDYLFSTTLSLNTWFHVAVSRSSSSMRVFVNGTQIGATQTVSYNISTNTSNAIGTAVHDTSEEMQGYLSNVRILKGTGLYAANFTPSTAPLTAIAGTSLLTCQSNRLIDTSLNNFAITKNGDTTVSGFTPFTPPTSVNVNTLYSTTFDGTGDYLSIATNSALNFGTGDFTIEAWVNPASLATFFISSSSGSGGLFFGYNDFTGGYGWGRTAVAWDYQPVTTASTNAWQHVAVSRSGTSMRLFVNGVQQGSTQTNSTAYDLSVTSTTIGSQGTTYYLNGELSNLRIVKGTAVYTANFTPPTAPLTAISGTSLLTCQSSTTRDNSANALAITSYGQAQPIPVSPFIQTTTAVDTTYLGSGYFDGTGDYLTVPGNQAGFSMGTGDFTIEMWIYITSLSTTRTLYDTMNQGDGSGTGRFAMQVSTGGTIQVFTGAGSVFTSGGTVLANTWHHLAVTKASNSTRIFLNGVQVNTTYADTNTYTAGTTNRPIIGVNAYDNSTNPMLGYITDLRVVKGRALYTANFAPPATPLTAVANTSLLTLQTDQPVANKQFVDNSGNNFPITQVGNTTQGTFSPYGSNWSNYFDGTGDYLSAASDAAFALPGNFTYECWFNSDNAGTTSQWVEVPVNNGFSIYYSGTQIFVSAYAVSALITYTYTMPVATWTHMAVVRNGTGSNNLVLYINGISVATATTNVSFVQGAFRVGGASYFFKGYISNARLVKGTAVYTANFTPPTAPLTAIANTSLLTCQDNRFVDDSPNNFTLTRNGDVSVQRFSPFSPVIQTPTTYSTYFDGSGDWLTVPDNAAFEMGSGNYTVEGWFYATSNSDGGLIFKGQYNSSGNSWLQGFGIRRLSATDFRFYFNTTASITTEKVYIYTTTTLLNTWYHVAMTVSSGVGYAFLNGTLLNSGGMASVGAITDSAYGLTIGAFPYDIGNIPFTGYLSNMRIVKGTAVYTAAFTPPTAPLTAISGTSLLACQAATHRDNSSNAFTLTQFGDAAPRLFNPFGFTNTTTGTAFTPALYAGSAYFDGTGDYLTTPSNAAITQFGTGDFTVECWAYTTSNPHAVGMYLFDVRTSGSTGNWALFFASGNGLTFFYNGASIATTAATFSTSTWYHIAYSRKSTSGKLFVNGVSVASVTDSNNYSLTTVGTIGSRYTIEALLQGYISDARIVKGTALYTGNFVPPLAPVTATTGTTLLLNMDKGAAVDSSRNNDLETVGDAKLRDETPYAGSYYSNFFNGTSNYFTLPASANWDFGTGDFTIECWVNQSAITATDQVIAFHGWSGSGGINYGWNLRTIATTGVVGFSVATSGGIDQRQFTDLVIKAGRWHHFAIVCASNVVSAYLDGVKSATTYSGATFVARPTMTLVLGGWNNNTESIAERLWFGGNISSFRIVKGTALYTANFTPSTTPLTAITNTQALLCQTNKFVDNSANSATITNVGAAVKSQNPFQKNTYSSMLFDGTGDYLAVPAGPQFNFGTGDFTIECWVNATSWPTNIYFAGQTNINDFAPVLAYFSSGKPGIAATSASGAWTINASTTSPTLAPGIWYHIAWVRYGNEWSIYVNGIKYIQAASTAVTLYIATTPLAIGSNNAGSGTSYPFIGYIADLRITKSARYTAAFTPPTAPLPTS